MENQQPVTFISLFRGLCCTVLVSLFLACAENQQNEVVDVRTLIEQEQYSQAADRLLDALSQSPRQPDLLYNLAVVQTLQGNMQEARRTALKAQEVNPSDGAVHLLLAELHLHFGDWVAAKESLNQLSTQGRQQSRAQYNLGLLDMHLGNMKQAENAFRTAMQLGDESAMTLSALAYVLIEQDRLEESKAYLAQAEAKETIDPRATRQLAECYLELGDAQRALTLAQSLEPQQRNDAQLWSLIGRSQLKLQRYGEAESAFTRALAAPNATPWHQVEYAKMLFVANHEDQALAQALEAEERLQQSGQPIRDPELHNLLATLYARRGQMLLAHKYLNQSLDLDQNQPMVRDLLSQINQSAMQSQAAPENATP